MDDVVRKTKKLIKIMLGMEVYARIDVQVEYRRFGSPYGGWDLVVDRLNHESVIYSIGVGEDASFDTALIAELGVSVHAFDPTPKSIEWVKTQAFSPAFVMHEYGAADFDGSTRFHPPENPAHVSHTLLDRAQTSDRAISVPVKRLTTIMGELGHGAIDVLKMDIEGAEYAVIEDMAAAGIRPGQLLVEFHHRFPHVGVGRTKQAIRTIRKMGYGLFSVSRTGEEYCFVLKDCQGADDHQRSGL